MASQADESKQPGCEDGQTTMEATQSSADSQATTSAGSHLASNDTPAIKLIDSASTIPTTPTTEPPSINFAASSPGTPSQSYSNLSYAPRQSPLVHARRLGSGASTPKQTASDASSVAAKALPAEPVTSSLSPSTDEASSAHAEAAAKARADHRQMMQEVVAKCTALGLNATTSPGWPLLVKLAEASDGEWKELADLVGEGDATLLLPLSSKPSSASSKGTLGPNSDEPLPAPSLSYAYDHILIGPGPRPALSIGDSNAAGVSSKGFATLSGLRGVIEEDRSSEPSRTKLTIKSFICRRDRGWVSELKNKGARRQLFTSLPPLPKPSCTDYPFPNYTLTNAQNLTLPTAPSPPPLPPRPRAGSSASLTAPGLGLGPSQTSSPSHRPSTSGSSFATLFGGSGRERKQRGPVAAAQAAFQTTASDSAEDVGPTSCDEPAAPDTAPRGPRKIHIILIDRPLRRSRALRGMAYSIQARLRAALEREAAVPPSIGEEIGSFASGFYPVIESGSGQGGKAGRKSGGGAAVPTGTVRDLLPAIPYTAQPDHLQMSFQSLYSQTQQALEEAHRKVNGWDDDRSVESAVRVQMESIEALLIEEVYDRIFSPPHSTDQQSDENLSSRIAALNVLGLDWDGLGIRIPVGEAGQVVRRGLDAILASCEAELSLLQTQECFAPRGKLDVLVSVHRIVVDGLAKLPAIELKDGNESEAGLAATTSTAAEAPASVSGCDESPSSPPAAPSGNTTSADLILPLLIRLLIKANPPSLNSHLNFVQRYRSESLLRDGGGETAYCLINFQAAVQFVENARPAELGLEDTVRGGLDSTSSATGSTTATTDAQASADAHADAGRQSAIELLKNVNAVQPPTDPASPQRPSPQQSIASNAVIGNVAGRMKGLSGVVNSSFSVLGKVIGSGASAGMEAWDRSSKGVEGGMRTLDDIRGLLGRGAATGAAGGEKSSLAAAAALGKGAGGTDYGREAAGDQSGWNAPFTPATATTSTNTASANAVPKPSLSDRLAGLNRRFASPGSAEQPLPPGVISKDGALPKRPPLVSNAGGSAGTTGSTLALTRATTTADTAPQPLQPPPAVFNDTVAPSSADLPASLRSPYPPVPRPPTSARPLHVVLASSGSVASIKVPLLIEALLALGHVRVQIVATKPSLHFYEEEWVRALGHVADNADEAAYTVKDLAAENLAASRRGSLDSSGSIQDPAAIPAKRPRCHLWKDEDEWTQWSTVGDPILHIELRRWADIVLVAPCSANTLAKIAGGLCDDLLTSFLRALSPSTPTLLFPAMNTLMYQHPLTAQHLDVVQRLLGYEVHGPIEKRLACGDLGRGAMLEWTDIVRLVEGRFGFEAADGEDGKVAVEESSQVKQAIPA